MAGLRGRIRPLTETKSRRLIFGVMEKAVLYQFTSRPCLRGVTLLAHIQHPLNHRALLTLCKIRYDSHITTAPFGGGWGGGALAFMCMCLCGMAGWGKS